MSDEGRPGTGGVPAGGTGAGGDVGAGRLADPSSIVAAVELVLGKLPKVEGDGAGQLYLAQETSRILTAAQDVADKAGDSFVTVVGAVPVKTVQSMAQSTVRIIAK